MVMARLLGCTWSVTVHANDMYSQRLHLEQKLSDTDRVITVCEYNRRRLIELEGVTGDIPIVVCGVENVDAYTGPKRIDVVAVGRLVEKKGFDLLVTAVALLEKEHPDLRVAIIGEGPEHESLQRLIDGLGLGALVTLHGAMDHDEVLEHIGSARVAVLPCRIGSDDDRDSMPVVVKEAMIRGVPVVGTDVAAMGEMLDGACGRLVPPNDPTALATAIGELLDDADLRTTLGASARKRAIERFVIDDHVDVLRREFLAMARAE
jgi:glycosyltransferase involved in cell wall biosynthesis